MKNQIQAQLRDIAILDHNRIWTVALCSACKQLEVLQEFAATSLV